MAAVRRAGERWLKGVCRGIAIRSRGKGPYNALTGGEVMKRAVVLTVAVILCLALAPAALADKAQEAKALVEKAVAMAKDKGLEAALKAVSDPKGPFVQGEFYVFAGDIKRVTLVAHPIKPKLVGKPLAVIKDKKGKMFFVEFTRVAKDPGHGWVEYWWPKPGEKKPSLKRSYIARVPGTNVFFGCGYYQ